MRHCDGGRQYSLLCPFNLEKAAETRSLLTHFIWLRFWSIVFETKVEELYITRAERLQTEYLVDTQEILPSPGRV